MSLLMMMPFGFAWSWRAVLAVALVSGLEMTEAARFERSSVEATGTARAAVARSPFLVPARPTTPAGPTAATSSLHWYKGNVHAHSSRADGDSTPEELVRWYREHNGYHFLVLTDHNLLTPVEPLNAAYGEEGKFLVIAGEEVTDSTAETADGSKPVHMNGIGLRAQVTPQGGQAPAQVVRRDAAAIRAAGGVPILNHPNYGWAFGASELLQTDGVNLMEVASGNPDVNDAGGGGLPSAEELWDQVLSRGREMYGVGADDVHSFKDPWNPRAKQPGTAWVVVRSSGLEARAIVAALERGEFYVSNGVELERIEVTAEQMTVAVNVRASAWQKGRIQFIGRGGRVLKEAIESPAVYEFTGDEGYVRARVIASNGRMAWVQPVFLSPSPSLASR